jgi:LCP family protein required for cell wall assembly
MGKMESKNSYLKFIIIALVIVFLIAGALLLLEVWETMQGRFPEASTEDGVVTYEGEKYVLNDNIETLLVLGLDKYEGNDSQNNGNQADFLMLFVLDNDSKQCTAIHINRDTMVNVNKLDIVGSKIETSVKQIALAYNHIYDDSGKLSCRNTADSVSNLLLDVPVQHYISFTMDSVAVMNDLVGGVEVTVLDDFTGIDDALVKGEKVTLMGEQALRYVRTRYGLEDSSNSTRMERQQQYVDALYDKTISCMESDDEFVVKMIEKMDDYIVYDSTDYRMKEFANKFDEYEFLGIREIEGESKLGEEFIEFYPDEDSVWETVIALFYTPKA